MTQITVRGDLVASIVGACKVAGVRPPTLAPMAIGGLVQTTVVIEWTPDLSPAEQTTVTSIVKLAIGASLVTPAERDSIEPQLATIRTFQQMSQSDFIALTQNARDRQLFDNVTAIIRILRVFLRD